MRITTGQRKVLTNTMKAYRKQRQYIYYHCQLCNVTPSYTLVVGVCLLMLPMLELTTEHVQLTTMYHMNCINHVHTRHMTFSHTPLALPSLNNVLPAMVLQNRVVMPNIKYPLYTSSYSNLPLNPAPTGLGRRLVGVVGVVVLLLLLMSGDIETNPGLVGEQTSLCCIGASLTQQIYVLPFTSLTFQETS